MYSTTHSIMFPNAQQISLYPFLNEIIHYEANIEYPYNIDEVEIYPDSDEMEIYDDYDDDYDEDNCLCEDCAKRIKDEYQPPVTRLQVRNQQALLNINDKMIEYHTKLSYYWFEYMEEQKDYTKDELEQKLEETDIYITEEEYRKTCDKIKERYEELKKDSQKVYSQISFIQFLMKGYDFDQYIENCKEEYESTIEEIVDLRNKIFYLTIK